MSRYTYTLRSDRQEEPVHTYKRNELEKMTTFHLREICRKEKLVVSSLHFACYVLADSPDEEPSVNTARLVVESIIRDFTEAPSLGKGHLKRMVHRAHTELLKQKKGMHLKASFVIAVTDYRKIRYAYVGNNRYYLIRNARILERTKDQSLTSHLAGSGQIPLDQVSVHEERNNLYSFLGERGTPRLQISRKRKLENGDIFFVHQGSMGTVPG